MIRISLANQKGGVGKSSLTILLANHLRFRHNMNVAVVDCNVPQFTVQRIREKELVRLNRLRQKIEGQEKPVLSEDEKILFRHAMATNDTGITFFDVYSLKATDTISSVRKIDLLLQDKGYDIVLYDIGGDIQDEDTVAMLSSLDYIFCPIPPDEDTSGDSSLNFLDFMKRLQVNGETSLKGLYAFFNMYDVRRNPIGMFNIYKRGRKTGIDFLMDPEQEGDKLIPSYIEMKTLYQRAEIRTTVFAIKDSQYQRSFCFKIIEQIIKIVFPCQPVKN